MVASLRTYRADSDLLAIRDLLVSTRSRVDRPVNWTLTRWEYARYFEAPLMGTTQMRDVHPDQSAQAIRFWEDTVGVWEDERGDIVGAAHCEYPWLGHAFLQRHSGWDSLLDDMLAYTEDTFYDPEKQSLRLEVYDHDAALWDALRSRGWAEDVEHTRWDSEYVIDDLPTPNLPAGYAVRSMADCNDIEARRKVLGLGFDHPDPAEWTAPHVYEELQRAPDYRKDLDLYVVGPDGEYVSCCIIWYDAHNQIGELEPVATHPDYRLRGFGREVVMEGIRRVANFGAQSVWVGTAKPFYLAIGFEKRYVLHDWVWRG